MNRKTFVTTLGTAGLGLGLVIAAAGGAPGVLAQEVSTPVLAQGETAPGESDVRVRLRSGEAQEELYAEFTAALASELGISASDEVDAAIRVAMMTVVDARVDEGLLTVGQAEALKLLIATSDVPLGPGPMFGPPPGAFMIGMHEHAEKGRVFIGRGGDQHWTTRIDDGSHTDGKGIIEAPSDQDANDDSPADEAEDDASS
jgi:hypothetical protein